MQMFLRQNPDRESSNSKGRSAENIFLIIGYFTAFVLAAIFGLLKLFSTFLDFGMALQVFFTSLYVLIMLPIGFGLYFKKENKKKFWFRISLVAFAISIIGLFNMPMFGNRPGGWRAEMISNDPSFWFWLLRDSLSPIIAFAFLVLAFFSLKSGHGQVLLFAAVSIELYFSGYVYTSDNRSLFGYAISWSHLQPENNLKWNLNHAVPITWHRFRISLLEQIEPGLWWESDILQQGKR